MNGPVRSVRSVEFPTQALRWSAPRYRAGASHHSGWSSARAGGKRSRYDSSAISTTSAKTTVNISFSCSRLKASAASNSMGGRPSLRPAIAFWSIYRAPQPSILVGGSPIIYRCTCRGRSSFPIGRHEWTFRGVERRSDATNPARLVAKLMKTDSSDKRAPELRQLLFSATRQAFASDDCDDLTLQSDCAYHRIEIVQILIDRHLTEKKLTPQWLANRVGVSLRTLQGDFSWYSAPTVNSLYPHAPPLLRTRSTQPRPQRYRHYDC